MSQENVEIVRDLLSHFSATHTPPEFVALDLVWDLTNFEGWPGRTAQSHRVVRVARTFVEAASGPPAAEAAAGERAVGAGVASGVDV